jgi:hypothetical protein
MRELDPLFLVFGILATLLVGAFVVGLIQGAVKAIRGLF